MFWLMALALHTAHAQEEVIVYEDDFARWDGTRWFVLSEVLLPIPVNLSDGRSQLFRSPCSQVRLVLACEKESPISKKKFNVDCKVEDVGIQAVAHRRQEGEHNRTLVQNVLNNIDARLTGATLTLQVDHKGGVNNVGINGWQTESDRDRKAKEEVRQLLLRTLAGFHQKIPAHAQRPGQNIEYNSKLMDIPSLIASKGSNTLVHTVSRYKGNPLIQTLGEGTAIINLPNPAASQPQRLPDIPGAPPGPTEGGGGLSGGMDGEISFAPPSLQTDGNERQGEAAALNGPANLLAAEASYKLSHNGVAIYDIATGIMTERVWNTFGEPTAGSAIEIALYRQMGKLTMLGEDDKPDVGPTIQVTLPWSPSDGLPVITSIQDEVRR